MPYRIEKRGSKWHVVRADTGEDKGESDSEEMAKKHLAALYAHEPSGNSFSGVRSYMKGSHGKR